MISFFRLDCAHSERAPTVDRLLLFRNPGNLPSIPGLEFMPGELPVAKIRGGGKEWLDCIDSTFASFPILFSERVVKSVRQNGLEGLLADKVDVDCCGNRKLPIPPRYFIAHPEGEPLKFVHRVFERIGKNYEFRFETGDNADPRLIPMSLPYMQHTQRIPLWESWDGSDFLMISESHATFTCGGFYCSRRVVELAKEEGWSNFSFSPIDRIDTPGGDFRELPWPPERWYPKHHPPG